MQLEEGGLLWPACGRRHTCPGGLCRCLLASWRCGRWMTGQGPAVLTLTVKGWSATTGELGGSRAIAVLTVSGFVVAVDDDVKPWPVARFTAAP